MSEAYKWLQTLPSHLREEMKSMEQVVSVYLRAKRLGGALPTKEELAAYKPSPAETRSSQDFHKSLQNLKHELDQFDFAAPTPGPAPAPAVAGSAPGAAAASQQVLPGIAMPPASQPRSSHGMGAGVSGHAPHNSFQSGANNQSQLQAQMNSAHSSNSSDALTRGRVPEADPLATQNYLGALKLDPRSRQILSEVRESLNLSSDVEVIRMSLVLAHKTLKDKEILK